MYPEPYQRQESSNYYFNYTDPFSGKRKLKSCKTNRKGKAKEFIKAFIDELGKLSAFDFYAYSSRFFDPLTNPKRLRLLAENKNYGIRQCNEIKQMMEKYVFPEPFASLNIGRIKRGDIIDLRNTLLAKNPGKFRTINKVIKAIASILAEALFRDDITANPASKIGEIKYKQAEKGIFSAEEILKLFSHPERWQSRLAFYVFQFAAYTGRRASEILVMEWEQLEGRLCRIDRAWKKDEQTIAGPKWGVEVEIPLPKTLILPERTGKYVFSEKGEKLGEKWWINNFYREMGAFGINCAERNITPHSFRHSLNTNLLLAGCYELLVKKYLGWTNKNKDTQAIYTHIKPEHLIVVADKIDEIYSGKGHVVEFTKTG